MSIHEQGLVVFAEANPYLDPQQFDVVTARNDAVYTTLYGLAKDVAIEPEIAAEIWEICEDYGVGNFARQIPVIDRGKQKTYGYIIRAATERVLATQPSEDMLQAVVNITVEEATLRSAVYQKVLAETEQHDFRLSDSGHVSMCFHEQNSLLNIGHRLMEKHPRKPAQQLAAWAGGLTIKQFSLEEKALKHHLAA